MRLLFLEIGRVGIDDRAVAVPFEIGDAGIFCHQPIHDAEDEFLYFGIGEIQHQLVAEILFVPVGIAQYPIAVSLVKFAAGADHFGFDPESETDAFTCGSFDQTGYAARQFVAGCLPVAEPLRIAVAGMFVAEPTVVEQEHIHTECRRVVHDCCEFLLIEIEIGRFPVVQQCHPIFRAVFELVAAGPVVHAAACAACPFGAEGEDEFRCPENLSRLQGVFRCIGINAGQDAQIVVLVYFESETEIAGPSQCAQQDLSFGFGHRIVERHGEQRRAEHVGPGAERRVEDFFAEVEPAFGHIGFMGPVACEFGEVVAFGSEVEHRRGIFV